MADAVQFLGDRVVDLARWSSLHLGHLLDDFWKSITPKWPSPRDEFVENHAQAEDVGSPIDQVTLTPGLFRTHISGCSSHSGTLAEVFVSESETEVSNERFTRRVDQDIGGLDVSVDQSPCMGVMQRFGDCGNESRRLMKTRS